jgi:hypothetical protein
VREVAQAGGPVKGLVPEIVEQRLRDKIVSSRQPEPRSIEIPAGIDLGGRKLNPNVTAKRKKKA